MLVRLAVLLFLLPAISVVADDPIRFDSFDKIDCHMHLRYSGNELAELARVKRFRLINVSTNNFDIAWQAGLARQQRAHFPGTVEHVTAFCMKGFAEPWWIQATMDQLDRSFENDGAIGVKIWKDVGMHFRVPGGEYILVDDDRFTPLLEHLEKRGVTLMLHMADPIEYWQTPNEIESDSRRRIVQRGGLYVMHGKAGAPSHQEIIVSRDRVLANHPKLKIVGVHLGSMEHDLEGLGQRLDRYPNFAVDTAARMKDLVRHPRERLRAFFIRYQDRILYGTDMSIKPQHDGKNKREQLWQRWDQDWNLLASDKEIKVNSTLGEITYQGLGLPESVLQKVYRENAIAWFPKLPR